MKVAVLGCLKDTRKKELAFFTLLTKTKVLISLLLFSPV